MSAAAIELRDSGHLECIEETAWRRADLQSDSQCKLRERKRAMTVKTAEWEHGRNLVTLNKSPGVGYHNGSALSTRFIAQPSKLDRHYARIPIFRRYSSSYSTTKGQSHLGCLCAQPGGEEAFMPNLRVIFFCCGWACGTGV